MLAFPAGRAACGIYEFLGGSGNRRVIDIELELDGSGLTPERDRLDDDRAVAAIEQAQGFDQRRLRLDRDDARAEAAERRDAVTDMGADVEDEIARPDETAIQPVH